MKKRLNILTGAVVVLALMVTAIGISALAPDPLPPAGAIAATRFREITVDHSLSTSTLDVSGGDITMQNDETLANSTDGVVQVGGNLAFSEGAAITATNDTTFTVTGSFQPLVSASALTGTLIADGSVAGQIVVLTNENASDNIVIAESGSNLMAGGDIQLDGGNDDAVLLVWTGDEWIKVAAFGDN